MKIEYEAWHEEPNYSEVPEKTALFFGANTPLKHISEAGCPPYEERPQQEEMARRTAEAFALSKNLCVEAPTGVGKSFAYLVPSIFYALASKKPVIISTETINLQEQLVKKDIPTLQKIMGVEFKAALAKGRSNYLCKRRLAVAMGKNAGDYLPIDSFGASISRIAKWAENTEDGSRMSIDFPVNWNVWEYVCSEIGNCLRNKCSHFRECFYWKARKSWDTADIIIANHALFFIDLKMKTLDKLENSILPLPSGIVIDEAHKLEDEAASHLGLHLNSYGVKAFLKKLFDPERAKGLLMIGGERTILLRGTVADTITAVDFFFESVRNFLVEKNKSEYRIKNPFFVEDTITTQLTKLEKELGEYIETLSDDNFAQELVAQQSACESYAKGFWDFINMSISESVYWIEGKRNDKSVIQMN
ncbi:MAG: ATP-dependent DNA helicase, partial [Candidatus Nanoarchaeia archaeon]